MTLVRSRVPFVTADRELRLDVNAAGQLVRENAILDLVARMAPEFS